MSLSVSGIITAAGQNRRMQEDLLKKKLHLKNKLLLEINGKLVIEHTIHRLLNSDVDEIIVVLGHFKDQIMPALEDLNEDKIKIVENDPVGVDLSQSLLNGVRSAAGDICLCAAGDQPSVTTSTFKNLIEIVNDYESPENILSVLSRGDTGFLNTAQGLGMPLCCHRDLLEKYLPGRNSNLNPILRDMVDEGVIFYGVPAVNGLEIININKYDDYLLLKKDFEKNRE